MIIQKIIFLLFVFMSSLSHATELFLIEDIPELDKRDKTGKYIVSENCPVKLERLKLLKLSYIDFSGQIRQDGKIIVLDVVAENTLRIFEELYKNKFPIDKIILASEFNGNDEEMMESNNSSAFNCRYIAGSKIVSIHSYGLAIDINPLQNPYIIIDESNKQVKVEPRDGIFYLNRKNQRDGMIENFVPIFKKNGFIVWGGDWNSPVDYHHFQTTRLTAILLSKMNYNIGKEFFNLTIKFPHEIKVLDDKGYIDQLVDLYEEYPEKFNEIFAKNIADITKIGIAKFIQNMRIDIKKS